MSNPENKRHIPPQQAVEGASQPESLITPSREWAWFMGILAGGGHINNQDSVIRFRASDENLRSAIKLRGERLLNIHPTEFTEGNFIRFGESRQGSDLGDFRRDQFGSTIRERHGWLLKDPQYMWSFLEGYFDANSRIKKGSHIILSTSKTASANFVTELLVTVGIQQPSLNPDRNAKDGINGIKISTPHDMHIFASHVHSVIQIKEQILQYYRELEPEVEAAKNKATRISEALRRRWQDPNFRSRIAEARRNISEETRAKISEALRGGKNPMYGKKISPEESKKRSESNKKRWQNPEYRKKISEALQGEKNPMYGKKTSPETRKKQSEAVKGEKHPMYGKPRSPATKAKLSEVNKGKTATPETRAKMSQSLKGKPKAPETRARDE